MKAEIFWAGPAQEGNRTIYGSSLQGPCLMRVTVLALCYRLYCIVDFVLLRPTSRITMFQWIPLLTLELQANAAPTLDYQ